MCDRIVVLVDMDCFYCQVETRLNPALKGKPMAVVQYNQWQGGGIIAVNYEARAFGVTRHLRGKEARKKCPDIVLVSVPSVRGKADISKYRDAGREVAAVFCQFTDCVERASVDEAYLDITKAVEERMCLLGKGKVTPTQLPNTFVVGFSNVDSNDEDNRVDGLSTWLSSFDETELGEPAEERLAVGGVIVEEMRAAVFEQTGFRCSAGIAHNKILAKLACGLHKPNRQTILPQSQVPVLYQTLPIKKVRSLGGKFGDYVATVLGCTVMSDLAKFSLSKLQEKFDEKQGTWLYNIARGIDLEQVTPRLVSKSIGCCKNFPGNQALSTKTDVKQWLEVLSTEVMERLAKDYDQNNRRAKMITVSYRQKNNPKSISSRCGPLSSYDVNNMAKEAYELLKSSNSCPPADDKWDPAVTFLGISAGKFSNEDRTQNKTINSFFKSSEKKQHTEAEGQNTSKANTEINNIMKGRTEPLTSVSYSDDTERLHGHHRDGESFFMAYFKRKHESKLSKAHGSLHVVDTKSERCTESLTELLPGDDQLNRKQSLVTTEERSKTESSNKCCESSNSNHAENSEQWISPHEIFPSLDEADEETIALLPSPMQRKIRHSIGTNCKTSNSDVVRVADTSSSNHCKDKAVASKMPGKTNTDVHDKQFTEDYAMPVQKQCSSDTESMRQNQETGSNFLATEVGVSGFSSQTNNVKHHNVVSSNVASDVCPHCKSIVLLSEYPEHLDFHLAEKLHEELNSATSVASTSMPNQVPKTKINLNKRKKGGNVKKSQDNKTDTKKVKSITSFFTPLK
ncbi:DNA polymerase eta [Schistocerca americana]|uniref:DNA polymerase eta n=1 Tax=Schistocerca americana TaxID=7009 RepID=UPI001F4F8688|nr:DNA polymerase eta [Schistocerca americana]